MLVGVVSCTREGSKGSVSAACGEQSMLSLKILWEGSVLETTVPSHSPNTVNFSLRTGARCGFFSWNQMWLRVGSGLEWLWGQLSPISSLMFSVGHMLIKWMEGQVICTISIISLSTPPSFFFSIFFFWPPHVIEFANAKPTSIQPCPGEISRSCDSSKLESNLVTVLENSIL